MPNLYRDTAEPAAVTPPLDGDIHADVAVVGAGFTGLSTALHLAEKGAKVVLLEAEEPGWGASGRNGGQVNPGLKHDPDTVERDFGPDLGQRMNALAGAVPRPIVFDLITTTWHFLARPVRTARCGRRSRPNMPRPCERPRSNYAAARRRWNWSAARNWPIITGTDRYQVALFDRRGGDVHPLSYARGLVRAAMARGRDGAWRHACDEPYAEGSTDAGFVASGYSIGHGHRAARGAGHQWIYR
jgi:glycine/D-amino acid oxidase-like deaminating enzyme